VPELPEVETIRRQLAPRLEGRSIVEAGGHPSAKFSSARFAAGSAIVGVRRRGKYLLIDLDDDRELVIHLGMTGRLQLRPLRPGVGLTDASPYVRAWWHLGDEVLELDDVRRFGRVAVVTGGDHRSLPTLAALGPEPLEPGFDPDRFWSALRASRARLKTQLLSQRPVAGVGNIYADEALWAAGINPAARAIGRARARVLHAALVEVLEAGLAHGGTTLRDYRALDGSTGRNQLHLRCYGRAGDPCERCGSVLGRRMIDGRATTWCRQCQAR
jgi:formamidopyrimidine-DNA glycosylase